MLILRSLIFNILFYVVVVIYLCIALPAFLLPTRYMVKVAQSWGRAELRLLRYICDLHVEVRGTENIPDGAFLIASKHQSAWETFALFPYFKCPTIILKRELTQIPVFGWALIKAGMIALDRGAGKEALANLIAKTRGALAEGRQVVVFPEGTRRPPGAAPDYKLGVVQLYANCNVPCVPVALNSGVFWPRRKFLRHPGTVVVEILPPLPPGMPRAAFFRQLQENIETATHRLVEDGIRERDGVTPVRAAPAP